MLPGRYPGQDEDASAYDTADAKHDEVEWPKNLRQLRAIRAGEALHLSKIRKNISTTVAFVDDIGRRRHKAGGSTLKAHLLGNAPSSEGTLHEQVHEATHEARPADATRHAGGDTVTKECVLRAQQLGP